MATLYENGLSGILADEMGLGKTIQIIALLAYLQEKSVKGPFIIAAPLATLPNWIKEFKKWLPDMPTLLYHGSKAEREVLRRDSMRPSGRTKDGKMLPVIITSYEICIIDRRHLEKCQVKVLGVVVGWSLTLQNHFLTILLFYAPFVAFVCVASGNT
jgi:ATP-dependent DNA helicase